MIPETALFVVTPLYDIGLQVATPRQSALSLHKPSISEYRACMYGMEKLGIVLRSSSRLALVLEAMILLAFQQETRSHAS